MMRYVRISMVVDTCTGKALGYVKIEKTALGICVHRRIGSGTYRTKCECLIREGICSPYQAELCGGRDKDAEGYCTAIYVDTGIEE